MKNVKLKNVTCNSFFLLNEKYFYVTYSWKFIQCHENPSYEETLLNEDIVVRLLTSNEVKEHGLKNFYDSHQEYLEQQRIAGVPLLLKKIKTLSDKVGITCEVSLDDSGLPLLHFPHSDDFSYSRSMLSVESDKWDIDYVLETLEAKSEAQDKAVTRQNELKAWWANLSETDQANIKEIASCLPSWVYAN